MGDTRFVYGYIKSAFSKVFYNCKLELKVVENDRTSMINSFESKRNATPMISISSPESKPLSDEMPPLKYGTVKSELPSDPASNEWVTIHEPLAWAYAGKVPYMAASLMEFPVADPSDGLLDVSVVGKSGIMELLLATDGADEGKHFWNKNVSMV
jgi:sphingosine kinase